MTNDPNASAEQAPTPTPTPGSHDPNTTAPDLRLRAKSPRVVRLSRKALAVIGAGAGVVIGGILIYALQPITPRADQELYAPEGRAGAGALADAPRDYSQVPRLGPPLPGDLGAPILDAQQRGGNVPTPPMGPTSGGNPNAGPDRAEQEREAARTSQLFMAASSTRRGEAAPGGALDPLALLQSGLPGADAGAQRPSSPQRDFLRPDATRQAVSAERITPPVSPYIVQAGAVIPAALITGIRSDLPGQITAQVTQPVYDSPTGRLLLIPQGSRLIGEYDADVSFGQQRVLLAWDRLIFPDGRSIMLLREPGADGAGYAGLEDRVNNHWGRLMRAALVSTLLGVGAELAADDEDALIRALRRGTQDTINQAGQRIVERELAIRPTLNIRPGHPVRVIVTRDLVLAPTGAGQ